MLIDTHSHLYLDAFSDDRSDAIDRAREVGVNQIFLPAIDSEHHSDLIALSRQYPAMFKPMMGLHPCSVKPDTYHKELEAARLLLDSEPCIAVGEIGIDLYWDKSTLAIQKEAFKTQIAWAKERKLPIVIHCREAFAEIFEVLDEVNSPELFGVFHCFTGNLQQAQRIIAYQNFMLGIGGVLTFKNSGLDKVIADVDISHLVLETDAPYLAPHPFRGKRNESAYVQHVCEKLAQIKGLTDEQVAEVTTANALKIFQL